MSESSYIKGSRLLHNPAEDEGLNLSFMGIPPESMSAWTALQGALLNAPNTPCNSPNRADWTTGGPRAKQRAAEACRACPVLAECRAYAEAANERGAVWGGIAR